MAAPNEGTTNLPSDAGGRYHLGLWDGTNYRAWRGDSYGSGQAKLYGPDGSVLLPSAAALADGAANPTTSQIAAPQLLFNGTTWDRERNNLEGTLLTSAARTTGASSADQVNRNARGVIVTLEITAASGTGGVKLWVYHRNPVSANSYIISADMGYITTTGFFAVVVYPGAISTGTLSTTIKIVAGIPLPRTWLVATQHSDGSSYTYSVGYAHIL